MTATIPGLVLYFIISPPFFKREKKGEKGEEERKKREKTALRSLTHIITFFLSTCGGNGYKRGRGGNKEKKKKENTAPLVLGHSFHRFYPLL